MDMIDQVRRPKGEPIMQEKSDAVAHSTDPEKQYERGGALCPALFISQKSYELNCGYQRLARSDLMTPTDSFFAHWYFHVPNLMMAALIYSLIGRYLLELFFAGKPDAVILKVFRQITDPVVIARSFITPQSCRTDSSLCWPSSG